MKASRIVIGLTVISLIGTFIIFPYLPNSIPIHWGINGSVKTAYKGVAFISALLPLAAYFFKLFKSKIDPKSESYEKHKKAFNINILTIALVLFIMHWASLLSSIGYKIDVRFVAKLLTGIVCIILGNYMGQIRHNYFFGIKNPWTYASAEVWKKTHRMGGYAFILAGIIIFISSFFSRYTSTIIMISTLFIVMIFNTAYSYLEYRKLKLRR